MEASKTAKKKKSFCLPFTFHLKQKKMNSRNFAKNQRKPTVFFRNETRACVIRKHSTFTDLYSQAHEKQRTFRENRKTLETSESAPQTSEMPSEASETTSERHRKDIGKASERKLWPLKMPFVLTSRKGTRASERHRKGIEKHLETLESIGKHRKASERKTSEPPWKNLNKDGNSRSLSDSLILQYKAAALRSLEIAVFLYFNSLLVCSAVKVDRDARDKLVHQKKIVRHMRLSMISLRLPGFQN